MWQQFKLCKDLLGIFLNRQRGMALLEHVQASDLSEAARTDVSRILRTMLRLPDPPGAEPATLAALGPAAPAAPQCQRHAS